MRLERLGPYLWEIPADAKPGMRVPARVVADDGLIGHLRSDASLDQLANGATLPGIVRAALAMPDIHQGYGLPVGGVVATDAEQGVVSPGAIGFDINCGVRLLRSNLERNDVAPKLQALADGLYAAIPTGVGSKSRLTLRPRELDDAMARGAGWAVDAGLGYASDADQIESNGALDGARPESVSAQARERGLRQLGSLGSGNHFLELQIVDEVYDAGAAQRIGLREGLVTVMIHTGSRGLGHQVCTDFLKSTEQALRRYGITVPDRQLACAPAGSDEARAYLGAMRAAANFAFANRQVLAHWTREVFARVLERPAERLGLVTVYDVAHNVAKIEDHEIDGRRRRLIVHRKGATRAFPGQPVLVPGDMGRYSYVLLGTDKAMAETFGSTCHGAGRLMSRTAAVKAARGRNIGRELAAQGIVARATGRDALAEEMPEAYKDVREVVGVVHGFGISTKVARLKPLAVIKG
ncbi:MAG: RtcB family protein [Candidatus Rokubacteria bacterium]|nr:RtcB family protein [Candidatus Rokubacteria bacterium]